MFAHHEEQRNGLPQSFLLSHRWAQRILLLGEASTPIRSDLTVTGLMPDTNDGVHGSRPTNDDRRACLLPHDEEPMWTDGDASLA